MAELMTSSESSLVTGGSERVFFFHPGVVEGTELQRRKLVKPDSSCILGSWVAGPLLPEREYTLNSFFSGSFLRILKHGSKDVF